MPPSDYLGHPNPCRIHHIFEQFHDFGDEVYTMRFPLRNRIVRQSSGHVFSMEDVRFKSPSAYYLANSGVFMKSATDIIRQNDIDIALFANLYPPYVVSRVMPNSVVSVVDLVDNYSAVAARNIPKFVPKYFAKLVFSKMMKSIMAGAKATVACSYMLARYAKQNGANYVYRIPNGVEECFFLDCNKEAAAIRQNLGIKESDLVICFVGNLEYWLDMNPLLNAIYLAKKNSDRRIKFLIVGGKLSSDYADEVEREIRSLCLQENVVNVGFVFHNDVPKYIAASDLCVSPKNIVDPVSYYSAPVKVWEYLAQGKPVISTPIPEVVLSSKNCVSIANTASEYFTLIKAFIRDKDDFVEKAKKGRELAKEQSWKKIGVKYHNLLLTLKSK